MSVKTRRLEFVDSNILVYAHDRSPAVRRRSERARALLERLWEERTGCLSVQVLQEFYVITTRKIAAPLPPDEARGVLEDFSAWQVHSPTARDVLDAIRIHREHRISFCDAMIIGSAAALRCTIVWTEDLSAGRCFGDILISNPFTDQVD
jgi:predicted nucleic acid-binding protein